MYNNDYYIEVADISTENEYIKIYTYEKYALENYDEIMPFCTYYFNALSLCLLTNDVEKLSNFDRYIDYISKAWFIYNPTDTLSSYDFIKQSTNELRKIIRSCEKNNNGINIDSFNNTNLVFSKLFEDKNQLSYIESKYKEWANNHQKEAEYYEKEKLPCVAIAMPVSKDNINESNCFLSLSGAKKDYCGSLLGGKIRKDILKAYDKINDMLKYIYGFKFIECHLNDKVCRYTYYNLKTSGGNWSFDDADGRVLSKSTTLEHDYKTIKNFSVVHYSCCERKIINYMKFVNKDYKKLMHGINPKNKLSEYEFRILKEPCKMCRPALVGCLDIKFGYKDTNELIDAMTYKTKKRIIRSYKDKKEPFILG